MKNHRACGECSRTIRKIVLGLVLVAGLMLLIACSPQVVEKVVEKPVVQTVVVEKPVEKVVEKVVEKEAPPAQVMQVVATPVGAPEAAAPSGWDTEWSQKLGIKLLQSFDSSGPDAWDPKEHPVVFVSSEGMGYGGLLSEAVTTPGLAIIDAYTQEVVATAHFDLGYEEYFEVHGSGVSPDGRWIYIPTAEITKEDIGTPGRWLVVDARTLKLHQVIGTRSAAHHVKGFHNAAGQPLTLAYDFNWQIGSSYMRPGSGVYVFDPKDDNRVVGGINADALQANPYLAFASPDGQYVSIGLPPGPIRDPDIRHHLDGTWAIVSTETWQPVKYYVGGTDPIWTAFSSDGRYAYLCDGGSDEVFKVDMEAEEVVGTSRLAVHGGYGCHLGWDDINLWVVEKGEASHNRGKNLGLVDVEAMLPRDNWNTDCLRGDHGIVHPDPEINQLWVSCNSSFEVLVFDMGNREIAGRIPLSGSTHSGAFVRYNPDFTGEVLSDQNGLHGPALEQKRALIKATASK